MSTNPPRRATLDLPRTPPPDLSPPAPGRLSDGVMTVEAVAAFTTLSRRTVWRLMDAGKLPHTKVGRRRLIPRKAVVRLLAAALTPETY